MVGGEGEDDNRGDNIWARGFNMIWQLRSDGERMDRLWVAEKERRDSGTGREVGGGGRGGGMALTDMPSNVLFVEMTADGDKAMEIDGEEMAQEEAEAAVVAEEEGYCLRELELSSLHRALKVRENNNRGGGRKRGG